MCLSCKQKTLDFYNYFTVVKSNQNILRNAVGKKLGSNNSETGQLPCKTEFSPQVPQEDRSSGIQFIGVSSRPNDPKEEENKRMEDDSKEDQNIEVIVEVQSEKPDSRIKLEQGMDDEYDHLYEEEYLLPEFHPTVKVETEEPKFKQPLARKSRAKTSRVSKALKPETQQKKYNKKGQKGHRSCDLCGASYEYRELLVTHMKRRHIFEDVECNICHKKFDNKVKLQSHTAHHNKKHMCEICSKSYVSPNQLKRHMQVHKIISNDFICSKCGEGFATRNLLADHVRKFHDGDDEGQLFTCMCDICGKKFLEESSMNVHKRTHNPNIIKALYCPVSTCGERMKDQAHLAEHIQIHSIVYNCSICARRFLNAGDLADHEKTHENEHRPFECQICNRRYSNKNQLNVHVLRVHRKSEANLHECELCSKTFLAAWELRVHERSHSSEKIAKCPMCERSYKSTNDIKKHMAVSC